MTKQVVEMIVVSYEEISQHLFEASKKTGSIDLSNLISPQLEYGDK